MDEENFTEEEAREMLRTFSETKTGVHSFFTSIIKAKSTTKTGNLNKEELGLSNLPLRSMKELELFCNDVWEQEYFGTYFDKLAEIQTATSLSKDAILIKLSVTQKHEKTLTDATPPQKKPNKGWFGKKEATNEDTMN